MRIIVTGTPGTGKTTIARKLADKLNLVYINLNEELIRRGVCKYNPDIASYEITNVEQAERILDELMASYRDAVFDTLLIELVNPDLVDWVIVLRLDPYELFNRLKRERKWSGRKLCENVLAEILDYFLIKAVENVGNDKIVEIDTTGKSPEDVVQEIIQHVHSRTPQCGIVDWLGKVDPEFLIQLDLCREGKVKL